MPKRWALICLSLIAAAADRGEEEVVPLRTSPEDNIRMREGAAFKIALFADLHFGEDAWTEWGPRQDLNSIRLMSAVLDKEQPDFVIYLGDVITGNNIMTKNASMYWDQAISPTRDRGVPWASVFGNHDDASFEWPLDWFSETGIPKWRCSSADVSFSGDLTSGSSEFGCSFRGTTRLELIRSEIKENRLSYSEDGPQDLWPSVSNYVLKVSNSQEIVAYMYFFDSGGGSYPEVISNAQVRWFQKKSEEVNPQSSVPEIIFWHIPSKAYKEVDPRHPRCVGSMFFEDVAAQEAEMGIMGALEQRHSVKAIFVGHNHGLDWCCPYKMLWLCFARHSGYGGYGNWSRGARILEITQQPFSLKSWITMEDGHTHSEVLLSS